MNVLTPISALAAELPVITDHYFAVVIVGGGAAGITVAAELLRRRPSLSIAVIEPSETHSYQPGWTLVSAGVFSRQQTQRSEAAVMPRGVTWLRQAAKAFAPERNRLELADGRLVA